MLRFVFDTAVMILFGILDSASHQNSMLPETPTLDACCNHPLRSGVVPRRVSYVE